MIALGAGVLGAYLSVSTCLRRGRPETRGETPLILRFLSAAEILETDLWQQYNELGGIQDARSRRQRQRAVHQALTVLDSDMAQYVHDNTDDEITHFKFLNAYLKSRGASR